MYSSPLNWFSILFCFICSFQMVYSLLFHCILFLMCDFLLDFILLILFFFHYFSNYFIFFSVCQYYAFFFFKCGLLFWHAFIVAFTFFFFFFFHCSTDETLCQVKSLFKFSLNKRWAPLESIQMQLPKRTSLAQLSLDYIPW